MHDPHGPFLGAKLILFAGPQLIVLRRDFKPGLVWPGYLDFPGGGREGDETPAHCALRETREELGLEIPETALRFVYRRVNGPKISWFYTADIGVGGERDVVFGDEGAGWLLMSPRAFIDAPDAIPHFRDILRQYLDGGAGDSSHPAA
ncbi:MAG: NUDIX hydrolase [Pelagimonas sp.]|nr:NUDIX hydrolase [Pelagimonas sp.]